MTNNNVNNINQTVKFKNFWNSNIDADDTSPTENKASNVHYAKSTFSKIISIQKDDDSSEDNIDEKNYNSPRRDFYQKDTIQLKFHDNFEEPRNSANMENFFLKNEASKVDENKD